MYRIALFLRSLLFTLWMLVVTVLFAPTCFISAPFPYRTRYWWTSRWTLIILWGARHFCGIHHQVKGMENLPPPGEQAILLSKHQSAWETIFYVLGFRGHPLTYVFKKELLYVPFFGWGIGLLRMIPIDRSKGKDAFAQVVEVGRQRLAQGIWIIMFPEGTRTKVGSQGKYKMGGTRLAVETGTQVVPVAVNSGDCWPKNSFIKKPGTITVSIGKPIPSVGREPAELMQEVENWIESEMRVLSPHAYATTDRVAKQAQH